MMTSFSLRTLRDISRHRTIGPYLCKVIIGLDVIPDGSPPSNHVYRNLTPDQISCIQDLHRDQQYITCTGSAEALLTESFRNLKHCWAVEIRDFHSKTRPRDDGVWKSYGATTYIHQTGLPFQSAAYIHHIGYRKEWSARVFRQVCSAVIESGMRCKSLTLINRFNTNALFDSTFWIPAWRQKDFVNALQHTTSFAISIDRDIQEAEDKDSHFPAFLQLMPNIVALRINFVQSGLNDNLLKAIQVVLASTSIERFEVGKIKCDYDSLKNLISSLSQKVTHLYFFQVSLLATRVSMLVLYSARLRFKLD